MQLAHIAATLALLGGALARHDCVRDNPHWPMYSQSDAYQNIADHRDWWSLTRNTDDYYAYEKGNSKLCIRVHDGGKSEIVTNVQIANAADYIYNTCCSGGQCYPGWAELHVKDGYKTYITMSNKQNDCTKL